MTSLVCALLLDLDDAADFPGNEGTALGRAMPAYPLMAARTSAHVRRIYALTASPAVKSAALQYDAVILDPPAGQPGLQACLLHGYRQIVKELAAEDAKLEVLAVLLANAPAVTKDAVDSAVEALLDRPELDSALTVAAETRKAPALARRQDAKGLLVSFLPSAAGLPAEEPWYPTWSVTALRPACLENPRGEPPLPWLGTKVLPVKQWGPGPIDYHWQLPALEFWLRKNGVSDLSVGLERQPLPKPQLSPKSDRR
ncbi:MAG: hypothetical protein PHF00_07355 [Elusimicrobia bacterium]|nr:hypothetical protein [Elusimicrobiota bacterium]